MILRKVADKLPENVVYEPFLGWKRQKNGKNEDELNPKVSDLVEWLRKKLLGNARLDIFLYE